jgi:hypothetical protein
LEDIVKIVEDFSQQTVTIDTSKYKQQIILFVPLDGFSFWKARFKDGTQLSGLEGQRWSSSKQAILAIRVWLKDRKKTLDKKRQEIFGDEKPNPPKLKTKPVRKPKSAPRDQTKHG